MRLSGEFIIIFFMKRLIHANKTLSRSTTREATRIYQVYKYKIAHYFTCGERKI